jgi:hypothetical protein
MKRRRSPVVALTAALRDDRASAQTRVSENNVSDSRSRTMRPRRPACRRRIGRGGRYAIVKLFVGGGARRATLFATTAIAGGLPKEGAFSVADETRGSYQRGAAVTPGEAGSWYESGKIVGDGILKGMAWNCVGMPEIIEGTLRSYTGYCVGMAQDGDQVAFRIVVGLTSKPDEKSQVSGYSTEGTGKYSRQIHGDVYFPRDENRIHEGLQRRGRL